MYSRLNSNLKLIWQHDCTFEFEMSDIFSNLIKERFDPESNTLVILDKVDTAARKISPTPTIN